MRTIIDKTKAILEKGKSYVYHKEQNKTAKSHLKIIEQQKGKLDAKNIKLCKEYAIDVLGNKIYSPWLVTYCTFAREFKEGWIPDNYYGEIVLPQLNGDYGRICNRNPTVNTLIEAADALDICYYTNGLFLNTDCEIISEANLKKSLFDQNEKVVFKIENSRQGKGVYLLNKESFDINFIKKSGNGVFQKHIKQHSIFNQFSDTSVATIRITTIINNDGEPEERSGYFKFGSKNDTHVKSASAFYILIDVKTGILDTDVYTSKWLSFKELPNDTFAFAGIQLPFYEDCVKKVKEAHRRIPYIRCAGWDVIVDINNEVKIIEVNGGHNGIKLNEAFQGPCFKGLGWENLWNTK